MAQDTDDRMLSGVPGGVPLENEDGLLQEPTAGELLVGGGGGVVVGFLRKL